MKTNTKIDLEEFAVSRDGVIHVPTEAHFRPHPAMPTKGFWEDGRLGTPAASEYKADQIRATMRRLWAEYLLTI